MGVRYKDRTSVASRSLAATKNGLSGEARRQSAAMSHGLTELSLF